MAKDEERMAVAEIKIENFELAIAHKEKAFLEKYKEEYSVLLKTVQTLGIENIELRARIKELEAAIKSLTENVGLLTKVYTEYEKKFFEKKSFVKGAIWAYSIPVIFLFTFIANKVKDLLEKINLW